MKRILEKQPAPKFKTANVAVRPRSHIFPPSNPALQSHVLPRVRSWNTPTEMLIGTTELCCTDQNVHFAPHLTGMMSRAVTRWLSAVVFNARGGLHYSKQARCMWTNKQPVRARADAGSVAGTSQREHMLTLDSPAACVSSAINTAETELQDNRFVVKAIWRVNKVASSNSVHEKDHSGPRLMGLFLKSKPQVVVSIQPSFVVQLGRCYTETRRRCKAQQLFVCVFNSSPLWNNIKPSHHPIPPVALSREGGLGGVQRQRQACGDPQHPEASVTHLTSSDETGCHRSDRMKNGDPN